MPEPERCWIAKIIVCSKCTHVWVAVYPESATELECPKCGEKEAIECE